MIVCQDTQEPIVIKVTNMNFHITNHCDTFLCANAITSNINILQIALQDTMVKCVLKCVITVPTILHVTLMMGIVNVYLAGLQETVQNVS